MHRPQVSAPSSTPLINALLIIWFSSLAMLEMQIVVPMFFKYFDAELDQSMTAEDMRLKDAFSGCPAGQRVLLKLRKSNV